MSTDSFRNSSRGFRFRFFPMTFPCIIIGISSEVPSEILKDINLVILLKKNSHKTLLILFFSEVSPHILLGKVRGLFRPTSRHFFKEITLGSIPCQFLNTFWRNATKLFIPDYPVLSKIHEFIFRKFLRRISFRTFAFINIYPFRIWLYFSRGISKSSSNVSFRQTFKDLSEINWGIYPRISPVPLFPIAETPAEVIEVLSWETTWWNS